MQEHLQNFKGVSCTAVSLLDDNALWVLQEQCCSISSGFPISATTPASSQMAGSASDVATVRAFEDAFAPLSSFFPVIAHSVTSDEQPPFVALQDAMQLTDWQCFCTAGAVWLANSPIAEGCVDADGQPSALDTAAACWQQGYSWLSFGCSEIMV